MAKEVTRRADLQEFLPSHRAMREWEGFQRRISNLESKPGGGNGLGVFDLGGPDAPDGSIYNMGGTLAYQTLQLRRGTSAEWATANPVLAEGEIGVDVTTDSMRMGDGVTAWASLPSLSFSQIYVANIVYPGVISAPNAWLGTVLVPVGVSSLVAAPSMTGSRGKSLVPANASTSITLRKNATTHANGTSVGTVSWSAAADAPTFTSAGFSLTGTEFLTVWGPATPDPALSDTTVALFFVRV